MISTSFGPTFVYWWAQIANAIRASATRTDAATIAMTMLWPPVWSRWHRLESLRSRWSRPVDLDLLRKAQEAASFEKPADRHRKRVLVGGQQHVDASVVI